ncbi:MAG: hypothetical protein ACOYD6_01555 [Limnochordia bacterium]
MKFNLRKRVIIGILLMLTLVLPIFPVYASAATQEREALFLASQRLLEEQQQQPDTKAGILATSYGQDGEFSLGARVESNLQQDGRVRLMVEAIYLKEEKDVAGFIGMKFLPVPSLERPLYLGGAIGLQEEYRFQFFGGLELTEHIFLELKYINNEISFDEENLCIAAGFQLSF